MTIGERIKAVRKENGLSLDKFGARIGLKQAVISLMENGKSTVTDQSIRSICREFHVNEDWLRSGTGEPYNKAYEDELERMILERGLSHEDYLAVRNYMNLPPNAREIVMQYMIQFAADLLSAQPATPPPKTREQIAEEEAEAIKRRILETNLTKGKTTPVSGTPRSGSGIA